MLCLGARAQESKVEVNYAGIDLLENDRGWEVKDMPKSLLTSTPLETGDVILRVGGQGVAQLGPLSMAALLEYTRQRNLDVVVERAGQEKELYLRPPPAPGSEERERPAMGATFRLVEDTQRIIVSDIAPGSPAERAGLKSDDELLTVEGQPVGKMTLGQIADLLSKSQESAKRLRVRREGHEIDITLKPLYAEQSHAVAQKMPFPLHTRGERAPDFSLPDLHGKSVSLHDFRGKPVLLTFWATWCRLCVLESPLLNKLNRELGTRLIVLGLNVDDDPKALQDFLQLQPFSYQVLIAGEPRGPTPTIYDLGALPLTMLIDADGFIVYLQAGFSPSSPLESRVRSLVLRE